MTNTLRKRPYGLIRLYILLDSRQYRADHEKNVFGPFDEHVKKIERTLNVTILSRNGQLKILGNEGYEYWIASAYRSRERQQELIDGFEIFVQSVFMHNSISLCLPTF